MVQLKEKRTAFVLYSVLLVLPTLVLGGLQWRQLVQDHEEELAAVPRNAEDAARRLSDAIHDRVRLLLESEGRRPFYHYGALYSPTEAVGDELALLASPLDRERRPLGVLAWFNYEPSFAWFHRNRGEKPELDLFWGPRPPPAGGDRPSAEDLARAAEQYLDRTLDEGGLIRASRIGELDEPLEYPLEVVAVNRGHKHYLECLEKCLPALRGRVLPVTLSQFNLQMYHDGEGRPWVVATRRAFLPDELDQMLPGLPKDAACIREPLQLGFGLVQGFFLDPAWLFQDQPRVLAARVLGGSERLVPADEVDSAVGGEEYRAEVRVVTAIGASTDTQEDQLFGRVQVAIDKAVLKARFRAQTLRFLGVAAMLALSLGTGMVLLLRSVERELEQAQRTENFVASITHELRTPLSAIKLHGEMLLEGWVDDPQKRQDYYRRIVRETERLSMLVERVLEKGSIRQGTSTPEPGDLDFLLERLARDLTQVGGEERGDVVFDLAGDLPRVYLTREAVAGIVTNLVENARKYAPVDRTRPDAEPIRVVTRKHAGDVVLEVLDRGPGVPKQERIRIFEAFYRVGDESTRTTTGTGLGLHLVALHAEAIRGRAEVLEREGGGALFRITFRTA